MRILLSLLLFVATSASVGALTIGGRLTTSLYSYEGQQDATTTAAYLRAYQSARLDLGGLVFPGLSFHTYLRGTTDLAEKAASDPRLRVYSAYMAWKKSTYQVQVGRQRVLAGVGAGAIDGLRGDLTFLAFDLTYFAGILVPLDKSTDVGSWSAGHLFGARLRTRRLGTDLALSFASRERESAAYAAPGRFSGVQVAPRAVVQRLVGLDLNRRFATGHSLYGRIDYDLKDTNIRRTEVSGRYALSRQLALQAEWFRRSPSVFYNSLFSVFPAEDYQEMSARVYYTVKPGLQLIAHFADLLYDGDSAQRLGLVASLGEHYSLGYYRTMGYSRASDGLVGSVYYPLNAKLLLRGELDLAAYERYEEAEERDDLVTGSLGLTYRPTRKTFVELQLQGVRNPLYSSDMRLFLRGSYRFFKAPQAR